MESELNNIRASQNNFTDDVQAKISAEVTILNKSKMAASDVYLVYYKVEGI